MKKSLPQLIVIFVLFVFHAAKAQVGIGTTTPNAQLEVQSSNQSTPANTDGIIIPKADAFPATNPSAAQQGMLVYLTTATTFLATTRQPGFYYWNNPTADWIGISSTANGDADWYEVGTATPPDAITDNMFHIGNVAIGKNTTGFPLDIETTTGTKGINNLVNNNTGGTDKLGLENTVAGTSSDNIYGTKNTLTNTGSGIHYGAYSDLGGAGNGDQFGNYNNITNTGNGIKTGTANTISGSGTGTYLAVQNTISGNGSGDHYGISNILGGNGNGTQYTIYNSINNLGSAPHFGVVNDINGNGNGEQTGVYNALGNYGSGIHYGTSNLLGGVGTGIQYGTYTNINNTGAANHVASENFLSGTGTGGQYGTSTTITNSGNSNHYGVISRLNGSGTGTHYGNYNTLGGAGTGQQVATYNQLNGSGNGDNYGTQNALSGSGSGIQYGTYTAISNSGSGTHYGNYNALSGNGFAGHIGVYNLLSGSSGGVQTGTYNEITNTAGSTHVGSTSILSGTGAATKYGFNAYIDPFAGGTHYGVYSTVLKAGATNFAGYFLGNVGIGTTTGNTYTFPASRGTLGQTMRTDALGNVTWANNSDFAWSLSGNSALATDFIGTTNAQPFRLYCNNTERMRINPADGEVVIGAIGSPYAGDAFSTVATPTLTFATNGYSAQNGAGIYGEILAASTTGFSAVQGVYSGTGAGAGVLGNYNGASTNATRAGVVGICSAPTATNGGVGVYGYSSIPAGNQHIGVVGTYNAATFGIGVHGVAFGGGIITGNIDAAVVGWRANNANYSGYFNGNHVIANGTKSASVGTSKGNQLLYATELPEVWFEDVGGAQLANGIAHIQLDPLFLETIFVDQAHPMRVFLQEEGESNGLIVIRDADNKGFIVKEKNGGHTNISFSYRIMAKRLHFQDHRFGNDPVWGEGDTRKYSQYAPPPPVDYNDNVRFQEQQKRNFKPTPMPKGFVDYLQLQKEAKKLETTKPKK